MSYCALRNENNRSCNCCESVLVDAAQVKRKHDQKGYTANFAAYMFDFPRAIATCACTFECCISFNLFSSTALAVLLPLTLHVFFLIYIYQRDMTVQFVACFVATFTIIFLLGCFCMSWQIFIGYRNIIRSAHNRPHKAPCHTVVGRRMRPLDPAYSFCAPRTRAVFSEKWKK